MEKFDVFICCAPKDVNKLPFCIAAVKKNVPGIGDIHVTSPMPIAPITGVIHHLDKGVLDINPMRWKYRPNWVYQQFLKMFQTVTKTEYWFVVDVDTIINRALPMFEGSRPIWYYGWDQDNRPYFTFQEKMIGIGKVCRHTFVADMNFFNINIINKMLKRNKYTRLSFIEKSFDIINENCYPAEPEIYGSYVYMNHPEYVYKKLKCKCEGKFQDKPRSIIYGTEEISVKIEQMSKTDLDTWSMHSWCGEYEDYWK